MSKNSLVIILAILVLSLVSIPLIVLSINSVALVDFTCNAGTQYAFTFPVSIDMHDGMNKDEAIAVAKALFNHEMNESICELKSAYLNDAGDWIVNLSWGVVFKDGLHENLSHYFDVTINVANRTVTYGRCY